VSPIVIICVKSSKSHSESNSNNICQDLQNLTVSPIVIICVKSSKSHSESNSNNRGFEGLDIYYYYWTHCEVLKVLTYIIAIGLTVILMIMSLSTLKTAEIFGSQKGVQIMSIYSLFINFGFILSRNKMLKCKQDLICTVSLEFI
jgi:hypothetical protein